MPIDCRKHWLVYRRVTRASLIVIKFRMVQSHEGGIGTVEECKLKPGIGAQIGETIFITVPLRFSVCLQPMPGFLRIQFPIASQVVLLRLILRPRT
jgi:hypothetical protein